MPRIAEETKDVKCLEQKEAVLRAAALKDGKERINK